MFAKLFVVCLIVVGSCFGVQAERPAGMVLYFKSGDEVFLLLADHREKDRGWAGYGGGPDEGESQAETAAREAEEETRGYFLRDDLLDMIKGQESVIDNGFALYFAEVPFVPAQLVTNNPLPSDDESYVERGPYEGTIGGACKASSRPTRHPAKGHTCPENSSFPRRKKIGPCITRRREDLTLDVLRNEGAVLLCLFITAYPVVRFVKQLSPMRYKRFLFPHGPQGRRTTCSRSSAQARGRYAGHCVSRRSKPKARLLSTISGGAWILLKKLERSWRSTQSRSSSQAGT